VENCRVAVFLSYAGQVGGHDPVAERMSAIPEVLEVHIITGTGDTLCRVVAAPTQTCSASATLSSPWKG
jgi:hypothetical protein